MPFDAARLESVPLASQIGEGWRHLSPGYDPLSGEGARLHGGRFNPPDTFPVLYLCETRPCAVAELKRLGVRQALALDDLLPRVLYRFEIAFDRMLDLTLPAVRDHVAVGEEVLVGPDWTTCQQLGEAAHALGIQAIRSPSAAGRDDVLAVLVENVGQGRMVPRPVETWRTPTDLTP